jgi:hypothetical protein
MINGTWIRPLFRTGLAVLRLGARYLLATIDGPYRRRRWERAG